MSRSLPVAAAVVTLALVRVAPAGGDGLPVLGIDAGPSGVTAPDGAHRYVTLSRGRETAVAAIERAGGRVAASLWLGEPMTIPAVAMDGTPAGLSHDRRTLVLIRPRAAFPRTSTSFSVVDTRRLTLRRRIRLRGDFSFDALSPDGRTTYLIHYTSRRDPNRYEVLRMETRTGRVDRKPIVDPYEPDEVMRGLPLTRTDSGDGRWAYTLYDGGGRHAFIHALDTVEGTARCLDLEGVERRDDLHRLRLRVDGPALRLVAPGGAQVAQFDRRTHRPGPPDRTAAVVGTLVLLGLGHTDAPAH